MRHHPFDPRATEILVFAEGDEFIQVLTRHAVEENIRGAAFQGIGAFQRATLAYFDWDAERYQPIEVEEQVEALSLIGDVAILENGESSIHAHVACGRRDGSTIGGHLVSALVRPTLELALVRLDRPLRKFPDAPTGLDLIDPTRD